MYIIYIIYIYIYIYIYIFSIARCAENNSNPALMTVI